MHSQELKERHKAACKDLQRVHVAEMRKKEAEHTVRETEATVRLKETKRHVDDIIEQRRNAQKEHVE